MLGELDEYSANYARTVLDDLLNKYSYEYVVFDLSRLDFMDSTGIGVLIGRYKVLNKRNKKTYICNPSKTIEKIFKIVRKIFLFLFIFYSNLSLRLFTTTESRIT